MNLMMSCFLVALTILLLIHSTLCASIVMKSPQEDDVDSPILTRHAAISKLSLLLMRPRRNIAQWYVGSHHFNEYNNLERAARRWNHRRHNNHNHHVRGQIADA